MSSALDTLERSLADASRRLHAARETAVTGAPAARRSARRGRRSTRSRLVIAVVALVIAAGGVAAASGTFWPSQRLADGGVRCYWEAHAHGPISFKTPGSGRQEIDGRDPIAHCQYIWSYSGGHPQTPGDTVDFKACQGATNIVDVFVSDHQPSQCKANGDQPLPVTYQQARARVRTLKASLLKVQDTHDCLTPPALAADTRAVLHRQGFDGWKVIIIPEGTQVPSGTGGECGTFNNGSPFGPPNYHQFEMSTTTRQVDIHYGPPHSLGVLLTPIHYRLFAQTYNHCYSAAAVKALVIKTFAPTHLRVRFASVDPYQNLPQAAGGCVRYIEEVSSDNNRYDDVVLFSRAAPKIGNSGIFPAASDFRAH